MSPAWGGENSDGQFRNSRGLGGALETRNAQGLRNGHHAKRLGNRILQVGLSIIPEVHEEISIRFKRNID